MKAPTFDYDTLQYPDRETFVKNFKKSFKDLFFGAEHSVYDAYQAACEKVRNETPGYLEYLEESKKWKNIGDRNAKKNN